MYEHEMHRGSNTLDSQRLLLQSDWARAVNALESNQSAENRETVRVLAETVGKFNQRASRAGRVGIEIAVPTAALSKEDRQERKARKAARRAAEQAATHFPDGSERPGWEAATRLRLLEAESTL